MSQAASNTADTNEGQSVIDGLLNALANDETPGVPPATESAASEGTTEVIEPDLQALNGINEAPTSTEPTDTPAEAPKGKKAKNKGQRSTKKATETPPAADAAPAVTPPKKSKEELKAERDAEKAARKAKKEAEAAAAPKKERVYFGRNKLGYLNHNIGTDTLNALSVLTKADAKLTGDDLSARQKEVQALIDGMSVKVKNRATYLLMFMGKGGTGKLNEVMRRAFNVLKRDGKITTGDSGNLTADLLTKPYDIKTARATGNNTVSLFKQLQIIIDGEGDFKGSYVGNPESIILEKINASLGI